MAETVVRFRRLDADQYIFPKHDENKVTHVGPTGNQRQIVFFIVDQSFKQKVFDSSSVHYVDMGSDHRTLSMRLYWAPRTRTKPKRLPCKRLRGGWKKVDVDSFLGNATQILDDLHLEIDLDRRCSQIEQALLEASALSATGVIGGTPSSGSGNPVLSDLIQQRHGLTHGSSDRIIISKRIQKEMKALKRLERKEKIQHILKEFRGLKYIAGIKTCKQQKFAASMLDTDGTEQTERQTIADIFATFYADLYTTQNTGASFTFTNDGLQIPLFTSMELMREIKHLKNNRCADSSGLVAEMLKNGGTTLTEILRDTFNQILQKNAALPHKWKQTVFKVLHKSGDERLPQNYRPIAIIPVLYKLFARLLCTRLAPILEREQCSDQAGFRHDYSTVDHLFTLTQLQEKATEYQMKLWVAAVDFKKAFDTIEHNGLWEALISQGVPSAYVNLLRSLYTGQTGRVRTDRLSMAFDISRGTKQGDPLSSLLFNAILEPIFRTIKLVWRQKHFGIQTGVSDLSRLTNLRFADDVLLVGRTQHQITSMLADLHEVASTFGLCLHPDKTMILTNTTKKTGRGISQNVNVNGMSVQILPIDGTVKYLGHKMCFQDCQHVALQNRIRAGWAKFMSNKQELVSKT